MTSKVDYDEAFIPATVTRAKPRLGEFATVPPVPDEACEKGKLMEFGIHVSDLNRGERLELQYLVNREYSGGDSIEPTGNTDRGEVTFCVRGDELLKGCNLVEALVAAEFNNKRDRLPYDAPNGDLASVHWWVIGDPTDNPTASALDCPDDVLDAGEL